MRTTWQKRMPSNTINTIVKRDGVGSFIISNVEYTDFIMMDQIGSEKVISMTPISLRLLCKLVLVSFLLAFLTISPAMAALNIVGSKFMGDVTPGQTVTFPMTLSVASTDSAADLELSVLGFAN